MRKSILLFISLLCFEFCEAQSINLEESTSNSSITDARNGSVALGDIDNDGDPDLFVSGQNQNPIELNSILYENDGNGNFTAITGTSFIPLQFGHSEFVDVDNDGDLDLFYTGSDFGPNYFANLYKNDGNGNFTLESNTPFQGSASGEFAFEDIDNDGDLDLLLTGAEQVNGNTTLLAVLYVNDGTGTFSEVAGTPFEAVLGSAVAFIDIDNDSDHDVIISGRNASDVNVTKLYSNNGMGNFSLVNNTPFENVVSGGISVGDIDNDGDLDIHLCGKKEGITDVSQLYINDGTGGFSLVAGTSFIEADSGTSDFVDFDNDGDLDLLITGAVTGAQFAGHIYENQGGNNFVLADSVVNVYFSSTAIADIDGDNDMDVVISGIGNGFKPRVYFNETITSIGTIEGEDESILVFPNPTDGVFQIKSSTASSFSIQVFDAIGKLVHAENNLNEGSEVKLNQPSGLYFIVVKSNNAITTHKLVLKK